MALLMTPYKFAIALFGNAADLPSGADYPPSTVFMAQDTGDLYVNDGTTFQLAGGGGGGGGGAANGILLTATGQTSAPTGGTGVYDLRLRGSIVSDPVAFGLGQWDEGESSPPLPYAAGVVFTFNGGQLTYVDTSNDAYDLRVEIIVENGDGSERLVVSGTAVANAGTPGDSATLAIGDMSVTDSAGTDLSYDDTTGEISSAGGGTYAVNMHASGFWD